MNRDIPEKAPIGQEPPDSDLSIPRELRRRTRRSFLVSLITAAAGYAGWQWLRTQPEIDGIPGPLRKVLGFNERLSRGLFHPSRHIEELPERALTAGGPRANGEIGITTAFDEKTWRLQVGGDLSLTLADVKTLPEVSQITRLHCIEGWTTVARWTGVRFTDFVEKFIPEGRAKPYVALTTPDNDYYVGLDASSAYHAQTLLCYAINGKPLSREHGAPLRLVIPTKYGIKNLKRVGRIRFQTNRPADYWAEQGYDWYAGL